MEPATGCGGRRDLLGAGGRLGISYTRIKHLLHHFNKRKSLDISVIVSLDIVAVLQEIFTAKYIKRDSNGIFFFKLTDYSTAPNLI